MKRMNSIRWIAIFVWILQISSGTISAGTKTSIVILLADDLGYGDVGYKSRDKKHGAKTPNIDELASSSHAYQMNNFHSAGTTCSPTRSSFLSGRDPDRECVSGANVLYNLPNSRYRDQFPFRGGMPSIAHNAQIAGYATGFFGKWHIGPFPQRSPGKLGFDHWVASTGNVPTYDPECLDTDDRHHGGGGRYLASQQKCYVGHYKTVRNFLHYWQPDMFEPANNQPGSTNQIKEANITRHLMSATYLVNRFESFVRSVPLSKPIFAYVWFNEVHQPFIASPEIAKKCMKGLVCKGKSKEVTTAVDYYGAVVAIDLAVGRVRAILREIGRSADTLLIFTSDNGPASPIQGGGPLGSGGPYGGFKAGIGEGSHRVPAVIEWPARIQSNAKVNGLASSLDLYLTFQDLFRKENLSLDFSSLHARPSNGVSLLPLLMSNGPDRWQRPNGLGICQAITMTNQKPCPNFSWLVATGE